MSSSSTISKKVILIGSFAVGKTSLTNQFVHKRFSNEYIATLGVKIDKKQVEINDSTLNMVIWDIADITTNNVVPESYFLGTHGIIYVFDLTRSSTFLAMEQDLVYLDEKLPGVPRQIVGNKADLLSEEILKETLEKCPIKPDIITSAKTGDHVESLFATLGELML